MNARLYWNLNNSVGNRNRNISARLVYGWLNLQVACDLGIFDLACERKPCPLAKQINVYVVDW